MLYTVSEPTRGQGHSKHSKTGFIPIWQETEAQRGEQHLTLLQHVHVSDARGPVRGSQGRRPASGRASLAPINHVNTPVFTPQDTYLQLSQNGRDSAQGGSKLRNAPARCCLPGTRRSVADGAPMHLSLREALG